MLLYVILMVLIFIGGLVAAIKWGVGEIMFVVLLACLLLWILPWVVSVGSRHFSYLATASKDGNYMDYRFNSFTQEGSCVSIQEAYSFNTWELRYEKEPIVIQVEKGKEFNYTYLGPSQKVVEECK